MRRTPKEVFALSKSSSPLAGMGPGQKIAGAALLVLALIAAIAFLAGGGTTGVQGGGSSSGFTAQSYGSSTTSTGASTSGAHSRSSRGGSGSLESVALGDLPREARQTVSLIDAGGPFPYSRDGIVFGNHEHVLPSHPSGWYHEYTVKTPGASNRGTRRIIRGKDGTMYYTGDHYRTFERVER